MQLILRKVVKSFVKPGLYFCDFDFPETKLRLKGILYSTKTKKCSFPTQMTEGGKKYSQFCFYEPETSHAIFNEMVRLLSEVEFTDIQENVDDEKKQKIILDKYKELEYYRDRPKKPRFPKKPFKDAGKPPQKTERRTFSHGTPPRPYTQRSNTTATPWQVGSGFTEIPVPKRGN